MSPVDVELDPRDLPREGGPLDEEPAPEAVRYEPALAALAVAL